MLATGLIKAIVRGVLVVALVAAAGIATGLAQEPPEMDRIAFVIATGPVGGSYMRAGEAIAITISHPPGLGRCEGAGICGPRGLIATARSSGGSVANALAVEARTVQAALVQGDVLAAAVKGSGPFVKAGALSNLRVVARLHDEVMHVVVSSQSSIRRLADLKGRRIAIDASTSDTEVTARNLLAAAGVRFSSLTVRRLPAEQAAESLRARKVDAILVLGLTPVRSLEPLFRRGQARLVGVDNRTLQRLVRGSAFYAKASLPAGAYRSSRQVQALGVASFWVVHRSQDAAIVTQILKAFWAPENRADLETRLDFAALLDARKAAVVGPLPLHEGAQRFYGGQSP
ncbi:MAG: TAXI family TRAP transporter solute-binding subunit [Alphaproteobacteria bacterium]|nr:TAXI family TRAP transporter solute-binding subunit [Alphaproteobacteria bacterium]